MKPLSYFKKVMPLTLVHCFLLSGFYSLESEAAGKKKSVVQTEFYGKKCVEIVPLQNVEIELPDQSQHNFGEDFYASLTTQLTNSGRYIVVDAPSPPLAQGLSLLRSNSVSGYDPENDPGYEWIGSVLPAARIRVHVEALTFQTGDRGDRMFYGFDERIHTPFNQGLNAKNEFPLRLFNPAEPSWFGQSFEDKGIAPFDSRSGLDLGDGFEMDALFAWLTVKYAKYHSELHLRLELDTVLGKATEFRSVTVQGNGFFFDVAGGYQGYSGGISVARRDAMNQALKKAIDGSYAAIDRALAEIPLVARIDSVLQNGAVLLGTGPSSGVQSGVLYQSLKRPGLIFSVVSSDESGSVAQILRGDRTLLSHGDVVQQIFSLPAESQVSKLGVMTQSNLRQGSSLSAAALTVPSLVDSTSLANANLPQADLSAWVPAVSRAVAFLKSLAEAIFLPYRVYRYFSYDQDYHRNPDLAIPGVFNLKNGHWVHQIGLDQLSDRNPESAGSPQNPQGPLSGETAVIAVIDSGMDYNHPSLHSSLWVNPSPVTDPNGRTDQYGWDFISNDARPYDDSYHGTQIASLVSAVDSTLKIMPLKVFNPWGITNSSSLYSAFIYAVDHGAKVIVCGWAGLEKSQAMEMGVAYAQQHGVIIVAAVGDYGLKLSDLPVYPAMFKLHYDNVITVASVDDGDQLVQQSNRKSSYDPDWVSIAAPGQNIEVAEPRLGKTKATSNGLSAALVAGVLGHKILRSGPARSYQEEIEILLDRADSVPSLHGFVRNAKRLRAYQ